MAVLAFALGWVIAGRVLRPVRAITAAARRISATSLHERLALAGPDDEFKELADTLDGLLARLEASFTAQRNFVASASHELRTPLTLDRTLLQVTLRNPAATAGQWRVAGQELLESGRQQERILEALLTLATSEAGLSRRRVRGPVRGRRHRPGTTRMPPIPAAPAPRPRPELGPRTPARRPGPDRAAGRQPHQQRRPAQHPGRHHRHRHPPWKTDRVILSVANTGPVIPPADIDRLFQPFPARAVRPYRQRRRTRPVHRRRHRHRPRRRPHHPRPAPRRHAHPGQLPRHRQAAGPARHPHDGETAPSARRYRRLIRNWSPISSHAWRQTHTSRQTARSSVRFGTARVHDLPPSTAVPGAPPASPRSARNWPPARSPATRTTCATPPCPLWLNASGAPAEVATRAGNSTRVLHEVYLHCIDSRENTVSRGPSALDADLGKSRRLRAPSAPNLGRSYRREFDSLRPGLTEGNPGCRGPSQVYFRAEQQVRRPAKSARTRPHARRHDGWRGFRPARRRGNVAFVGAGRNLQRARAYGTRLLAEDQYIINAIAEAPTSPAGRHWSSQNTPRPAPSVAVRKTADGAHRPSLGHVSRPLYVRGHRNTAPRSDYKVTHARDREKTARLAENSQLPGRFRRWWQVLGSNQRRLSRRFYRPLPLATRATCREPPALAAQRRIAQEGTGR